MRAATAEIRGLTGRQEWAESDDFDGLDLLVYINATSTRQSAFGAVFVCENV
jgi:hypothetical protein